MSDTILPCNSSYCSFVRAPQSSKECHFVTGHAIHSEWMLTLCPGDATNMLKVVIGALSVAADWVIAYADLLVDYVEYDDEWMVLMKCWVGRLENLFLGG